MRRKQEMCDAALAASMMPFDIYTFIIFDIFYDALVIKTFIADFSCFKYDFKQSMKVSRSF